MSIWKCNTRYLRKLNALLQWFIGLLKKEYLNSVSDSGVDGGWSDWSSWTECSETCGAGTNSRSRTCTKPKPSGSGKPCSGKSSETASCEITACAVSRNGIYEMFDRRIGSHKLNFIFPAKNYNFFLLNSRKRKVQ